MAKSHLAGDAGPLGIYSDSARRFADSYNTHMIVGANHGRWLGIRISDGIVYDAMSHETVFDTRDEAVKTIEPWESLYFYVRILPSKMTYQAASTLLNYNRNLYSQGMRMPAPTPMPTMPGRRWEIQ